MRHLVLLASGVLVGISSLASASVYFNFLGTTDAGDDWTLYSYSATREWNEGWPDSANPVSLIQITGSGNSLGSDYIQLVAPTGWSATYSEVGISYSYIWQIDDGLPSWRYGDVVGFGILFKDPHPTRPWLGDCIVSRPAYWTDEPTLPDLPDLTNVLGISLVSHVPVPEPSALSLLFLGALGMTHRRRRN